ncbi:hypothetical protein JOD54_000818 [Actinokineospora baliensis]|uniref:recombination directionality factor n=1 Tax=Actinokineospora baliensis TaxID=547056 RepID=UPI00195DA505|nr:hypothetical protein [Actinokineospora baliensis]MBM7770614.1 hypothetical protein [Actinokineospora baliensis]
MALRVFETDPDAKPKPRNTFADDLVGRFRSGMLVGRRPQALAEWRVTTDDEDVADRIAATFGGEVSTWDTDKADSFEVLTTTKQVEIVIERAEDLRSRMALFGQGGPIHVCDGAYHITGHPEDNAIGQPCGCPRDLQSRKDKSKARTGPSPDIALRFRLADAPDLGVFLMRTGSWSLVNDLETLERVLEQGEPPFRAVLELEHVQYTTKGGRDVDYHRPKITVR